MHNWFWRNTLPSGAIIINRNYYELICSILEYSELNLNLSWYYHTSQSLVISCTIGFHALGYLKGHHPQWDVIKQYFNVDVLQLVFSYSRNLSAPDEVTGRAVTNSFQ